MKKILAVATILIFATSFTSCGKPSRQPIELTEAHEKFYQIATEEYNLKDIQLIPLENTAWIYLPVEHGILDYKATGTGKVVDDASAKERFNVNHVETHFQDGRFVIDYDISAVTSYPKDLGYGTGYNPEFAPKNQAVFSAISRAYYEAPDAPEFFVVVFTDITRGLSFKYIIYLPDYKKQVAGALAQDEASKRTLQEMLGNKYYIKDKEGKHLKPHEITMPEFLSKQITNRVNFKYGRSNFPPSQKTEREILHQVYLTLTAYDYEDFSEIELNNLRNGEQMTVDAGTLEDYKDMPLPEGGKIHTIKFF